MGPREGVRAVNIFFDSRTRKIEVRDETSKLLRTISLARRQPFHLALASDSFTVVLQLPKEYDLVSGCNRRHLCYGQCSAKSLDN